MELISVGDPRWLSAQAQLQASIAASAQMKELLERSQKTVEDKNNEVAKLNEALGQRFQLDCALQQAIIGVQMQVNEVLCSENWPVRFLRHI